MLYRYTDTPKRSGSRTQRRLQKKKWTKAETEERNKRQSEYWKYQMQRLKKSQKPASLGNVVPDVAMTF